MMSGSSDSSLGRTSGGGYPKTTSFTPRSLLKRHPPPVAAHLRTPNCPPGLDLSRPLLIYSNYVSTKIRAASLRLYRDGSLARVGPPLVIPDSYSGWFAIISSDGSTAPCYTSIEQVVSTNVSFFLTRYDAPAYVITDNDIGLTSYKRTVIQGGNVLKLLGVFEDFSSRISECPTKFFGCNKYAQCQDFNNQVVYLPLNISGKFYSTCQKSTSRNFSNVYLLKQLIKNFKLPLTVKLVCGYMPRAPCSFTGLLRLEKSQQEEVMLACTMTSEAHATLFEIEVDSNFIFTPITDPLFSKTPIYLKTISYCQDGADSWQRQIKVTHHVTEKRPNSLSRSMSEKFVEPLHNVKSFNLGFIMDPNRKRSTKDKSFKDRSEESTNRQYSKRSLKKNDKRKLRSTKNDPYVFQLIRRHRSLSGMLPPIPNSKESSEVRLSQSFDNLNYSRVLDDISTILRRKGSEDLDDDEEDDHYTTIGEPTISPIEQTKDPLSCQVTHKENSKNKDKNEVETNAEENKRRQKDKEKDISKKESIDSGMYVDYDESYFSMDYSEVNTSRSEGSSEIVHKTKEGKRDVSLGNFNLGMTRGVSMPINVPSGGMGKETVSLLSYRDTRSENSFPNGARKDEVDRKSTASLNSKTKTPETNCIKNRFDKVQHAKAQNSSKYISSKKALGRSASTNDKKNTSNKQTNEKLESKHLKEVSNERNKKEITEKNSANQPTGIDDNARGNAVPRKDEYLIEGEDVSVINIETTTKSDILLRTSRSSDVHRIGLEEKAPPAICSEEKSNNLTSATSDNNPTSSARIRENITNDVSLKENLTNVNEVINVERDIEEIEKEVKVDLMDLTKAKSENETETHNNKQDDHGRNDRDQMCSGGNLEALIQGSDAKESTNDENKKMFPERESRLGSTRILMRGNTVVIRVKDAETKRPRIATNTFDCSDDKNDSAPQINRLSNESSLEFTRASDCNRKSNIPSVNIKRNVSTIKINKFDRCNNSEFDNAQIARGLFSLPDSTFPTVCNEEIELSCDVTRAKGDIINSRNDENTSEQNPDTKAAHSDANELNKSDKLRDTNTVINNCDGNKINFKINDVYEGNYMSNSAEYKGFPCNTNIDYDMTSLTNTPFSITDNNFPENNILHNFDVRRLNSFKISSDISRREESLIIKNSGNIKFSTITDLGDKYSLGDWDYCKEEDISGGNIDNGEISMMKDTISISDSELSCKMNSTLPSCQHLTGAFEKNDHFLSDSQCNSATEDYSKSTMERSSRECPTGENISFSKSLSNPCSSLSDHGLIEASNASISADQFGVVILTLRSNGFCDTEKKLRENKPNKNIAATPCNQSEC